MNKVELVKTLSNKVGFTRADCTAVVDALIETITETLLQGDSVKLSGFGNFIVKERAERLGRNPKENTIITIPARKAPVFKAGNTFKNMFVEDNYSSAVSLKI